MALKGKSNLKALSALLSIALALGLTTVRANAQSENTGRLPLRHGESVFTRADSDTLFTLPHTWIEADSVRIAKNGFWLEPLRDFRIMPPGHNIWVFSPLVTGDTLVVGYAYAPVALSRRYARRSLHDLTRLVERKDSLYVPLSQETDETTSAWTSLRKSGSLVRSIQIGSNQDLAFESALSLQVEGKVGSNVEVVAALSDQDLPIQPEGTTESIRELDKVYVTARSPNFEATIGDYEFELSGRRYDTYSRKLSGLKLGAKSGGKSAIVSAAISRGEFQTNRFFGEESVQGPYPLSGKNGEVGIVVLAGTETVWLDGAIQRRGENNDYVIDYAAGQITFSSRKLITSDSRIVVEFEYANEDYERQYWAARTGLQSSVLSSSGYVTYITERDDRSRPLSLSLSDEDRQKLERAGDSISFALSDAADSLGPELGDYVRRDSLIDGQTYSMFEYVAPSEIGEPQGEWQVFFDDFGAGHGDYSASADGLGRTFFYFVGISHGRYLPARRIPLPAARELVAFRLDREKSVGFRSNFEVAMSSLDRNTFSNLDDADNQGVATALELGYTQPDLDIGGFTLRQLSLGADGSIREKTFTDIARSDDIEFDREWAGSSVREATEVIGQGHVGFSPVRGLTVRGSSGLLSREEAFQSKRYGVSSAFQPTKRTAIRGEHINIFSEDSVNSRKTDWVRQRLEGNTGWKILTPRFSLKRERQLRDSRLRTDGFKFADWSFGNLFALSRSIQLDAEAGLRHDDLKNENGEFDRNSESKSYGSELRWTPLEIGRGTLRWMHRDKKFTSKDSSSASSDAGRLELLLTPADRLFELNLIYDALKSRTEQQLQIFLPTQPGAGSYRLENGVYVPDDQGNYELVSRNTGAFEPSSEINTNAILWFRPDETRTGTRELWQRFAFETEASLEERTRQPITLGLLLLDRSRVRSNETIEGRFSFRQDVHFNRLSRNYSLRLRGLNSAAQVSRFTNGAQQNIRRLGSLRARVSYSGSVRGETEVSTELERALFLGVSIASTDVTRLSAMQDVLWSMSDRWEAGLQARGGEAKDERSQTQASSRELAPRASYTSFRKGRADAEIRWIHVTSNRIRLPQELAGGSNRGENYRWSFRVSLALSENFTGSLTYTGRRDAGEETVNVGRVEVRAVF